ncbi:GPALPP motifs-containing protein 1 [Tribolium madens]|uniref:GPALPP motifs-containing protein 1 n=1 Tax=Tribolium madens TaxID=41895 RepID=UPI001CF721E2|nr:GPALPP motifs-containing protein 1 [Tribolium madens]
MNQFSDSESQDSDEGIRFKTESIRDKHQKNLSSSRCRSKSRSVSPRWRRVRSRSRSSKRRIRDRSRSRSPKRRDGDKRRNRDRSRSPKRRDRSKSETPKTRVRPKYREKYEKERRKSPILEISKKPKVEEPQTLPPRLIKTQSSSVKEDTTSVNQKSEKKSEDKAESHYIGPQLPPHLFRKEETEDPSTNGSSIGPKLPPLMFKKEEMEEGESSIGPTLPLRCEEIEATQGSSIGPQLPPHMLKKEEIETNDSSIGPQLPPHLLQKGEKDEEKMRIGPQLPPHLRQKLQEEADKEESDEDAYGPLPVGASNYSKAQIALEERALQLKMDQLDPIQNKKTVREEWMLELPEVKASKFGLGPRQFRGKAGPDMSDRSSWTDTPDKKSKKTVKIDLKKEAELKEIRKRDEEQESISKKHKKRNKDSLLEMHQSKMKTKKKEEPAERRPFSRDIDLQVNRFDEAQKKAVLKKAQLLDDRFSSGQSKFL